jgi:hypothetical protein
VVLTIIGIPKYSNNFLTFLVKSVVDNILLTVTGEVRHSIPAIKSLSSADQSKEPALFIKILAVSINYS